MINYESPEFASLMLIAIYVLTIAAIAVTVWSVVHTMRTAHSEGRSNGIPTRRIVCLVVALLALLLTVTALTASTRPLFVNGKTFDDTFWLRVSDMLIVTSIALIAIAAIATVASMAGLGRKLHRRQNKSKSENP